jgi:small-conductance mechanosensitive channel
VSRGTVPQACACAFSDSLVDYELAFAIDSFALTPGAKSEMRGRIADAFRGLDIRIGTPAMDVRIVRPSDLDVAAGAVPSRPNESR